MYIYIDIVICHILVNLVLVLGNFATKLELYYFHCNYSYCFKLLFLETGFEIRGIEYTPKQKHYWMTRPLTKQQFISELYHESEGGLAGLASIEEVQEKLEKAKAQDSRIREWTSRILWARNPTSRWEAKEIITGCNCHNSWTAPFARLWIPNRYHGHGSLNQRAWNQSSKEIWGAVWASD